jgi:ParB family transcriptional regulator, chromosome partitioning protein
MRVTELYNYSNQLNGSLEDLDILDITPATHQLRDNLYNLEELSKSIWKIGLLQPIVVRTNSSNNFEVVAGNRRLSACKKLGWRKIACHLVELDDKQAFEASIIENVQRNTLNPVEEGLAFRKYINEYGWGSVSELAEKLSKSTSYVCKRVKLTELPTDVVDLISKSEISASTGEELLPIVDKDTQSKLTEIIHERQLSSRMVRKLVKTLGTNKSNEDLIYHFTDTNENEKVHKIFDKMIISLRLLIKRLATIIETVDDKWIFYDILMQHKIILHQQIDLLIKQKRKYKKYSRILIGYQPSLYT